MPSAAVPNSGTMNHGVGAVRLISCIAAIPCAGGSRPSAAITNVENAKNTPPIAAADTAATPRASPVTSPPQQVAWPWSLLLVPAIAASLAPAF